RDASLLELSNDWGYPGLFDHHGLLELHARLAATATPFRVLRRTWNLRFPGQPGATAPSSRPSPSPGGAIDGSHPQVWRMESVVSSQRCTGGCARPLMSWTSTSIAALPSASTGCLTDVRPSRSLRAALISSKPMTARRSEEHTSELQSREKLVC